MQRYEPEVVKIDHDPLMRPIVRLGMHATLDGQWVRLDDVKRLAAVLRQVIDAAPLPYDLRPSDQDKFLDAEHRAEVLLKELGQ